MTVRWKPLLILSGVFLTVAVVGLVAITMVMFPKGADDLMAKARAEVKAKRFNEAEMFYRKAREFAARDPKFHLEFAAFYAEWLPSAAESDRAKVQGNYFTALKDAARTGPTLAEPRRTLMNEAIRFDDNLDAAYWAKELLTIESADPTATYILAAEGLEASVPNAAEIKRRLDTLEKAKPRTVKVDWVAARLAEIAGDKAGLASVLERVRTATPGADSTLLDRMALLKLRAMDLRDSAEIASLPARVEALGKLASEITSEKEIPSSRVARVSLIVEAAQRDLAKLASSNPKAKADLDKLGDTLEIVSESIFNKAAGDGKSADMGVFLTYADHLRFRDKREKCLEVVRAAFKSPLAEKQKASEASLGLHALAVECTLADLKDDKRYEKVVPHIKALLEGTNKRFQALGHLFQGAIDLESAGIDGDDEAPAKTVAADAARLRASALGHLKIAAAELTDVAEAQARYGVALIISREVALGRQYLQRALKMGSLDVQYLIWAAWSMVQGGYPEDAEPIVASLLADIDAGRRPKELAASLHLLNAEIHQARRSPADLKKAISEYTKSFQLGQKQTPAIHLRLAQIEIMLGRPQDALKRIDSMTNAGLGSSGSEQLAILTLQEMGKVKERDERLSAALTKYPDSADLTILRASLLAKDGKAVDAEAMLAKFQAAHPDNLTVVQSRAQILAESLKKPDEARALLSKFAETSESSAPLVQLALIELQAGRYDEVTAVINRVRARWKEAAAGDLLDAQLALAKGNSAQASKFFDAALKKDPSNKIVQYWKAQLDGRTDPTGAAKVFQALAQDGSVKELDENLSLTTAAQSALANLALESGDVDTAINRYEGLLKSGTKGSVSRGIRWQLVAAHNAKREWRAAKTEINALLNDAENPPLDEERVKAATYFRMNGEAETAAKMLDDLLAAKPSIPAAVVIRSEMLAASGKNAEALAVITKAIAAHADKKETPVVYFLLRAAVENVLPPAESGLKRAMASLDEGLAVRPNSIELVQAKCRVLALSDSPKAAAAFVEAKVKEDPKGPWRSLLVKQYRDQRDYVSAERVSTDLLKDNPNDPALTAQVIRFVAAQAIEAAGKGDEKAVGGLNLRTATLIEAARKKFPDDSTFVQLDVELAARKGEFNKAIVLTQEVDKLTNGAAVGSLLRAQIQAVQGNTREVARSYAEALSRNPKQPEVRLLLARASLSLGDRDEAVRQTKAILDLDPDQPQATYVQAQALISEGGSETQVAEQRSKAREMLAGLVKKNPTFADAYHLMADIDLKNGKRSEAVADLKAGLKSVPGDAGGLSLLIRLLTEPKGSRGSVDPAELADAKALADEYGAKDKTGNLWLAAAVGFHKTGHLEIALPYAEKATATMAGNPMAHLNHGDLLLSLAEGSRDQAQARGYFERAVKQYDEVLKTQPGSVEAVNNKAWILHSYLNRGQEAMELAQNLVAKSDASKLPAEFFDTLGTIQLAMGKLEDAEDSFNKGLRKAPEMPVLNYHMGKLMASTTDRRKRAVPYLEKAKAASNQLSPEMAAEVTALLDKSIR